MKFSNVVLAVSLALAAAPALVACSDSEEPDNAAQASDPANGKTISRLTLTGDDRTTLKEGETTQLKATLEYSDGTSRDITSASGVTWNTSDPSNATVSQTGLVTGVDEGGVEISVSYNGITQKDSIAITND